MEQPLYGLQFVGHNRVEAMAAHYIKELRTVQPHSPYLLGGASFGGAIAFEMARQLHAQGQLVALVALFDTCGPGYPQYLPTTTPLRRKVDRLIGIYFHHHLANLLVMESAGRKAYVAEKWDKAKDRSRTQFRRWKKNMTRKLYRIFDQPVPPALQAGQNPLREAILHYAPQAYPGKATLFRGSRQPAGIYPDPTMGWGNLAASLEIYEVPGFHNLTIEPRVRDLVEVLKPCLERAQAELPSRQGRSKVAHQFIDGKTSPNSVKSPKGTNENEVQSRFHSSLWDSRG
jgi:thioesterase domain-containing protein